ncbi:hypothetical protein EV127DRAFT_413334 [Xylaria flabelliformis]|nr:hypothetical protein EV127DRAFT_413334 [Xylaria flabelliformis]
MYSAKVLLALTTLVNASLAQTYSDPTCSSLVNDLIARGPTVPAAIASVLYPQVTGAPDDDISIDNVSVLLRHPDVYASQICAAAGQLPSSLLPEFATWGSMLLDFASVEISSYDAAVTQCVTTGTAAASITSYLHSIVSQPDRLCQPTSTSAADGNGTASITAYPTATASGNDTGVPSTSIPVAAAGRPTGALIGAAAAVGGLFGVALL